MSTHTPGPWTHNADEEPACCRLSILKEGAPIAEVLNVDDCPCLDEDDEQRIREVDEQARADARLIAAAPDLYAASKALRSAQRAYMADRGNEALGRAVAEAAAVLDSAIAKAEGVEVIAAAEGEPQDA